MFIKPEDIISIYPRFTLVTKIGSEYEGSTSNPIGIEGVAKIGDYHLRVLVPFKTRSIKLIF